MTADAPAPPTDAPVTVTEVTDADRAIMVSLLHEMYLHYEGDGTISRDETAEAYDTARARLGDMVWLLARSGEDGAGFVTATAAFPANRGRLAWWIKEVYVAAAYRRQGVGRAMLTAFLSRGDVATAARADIVTDTDNIAARGLYGALGATRLDRAYMRYDADTLSAYRKVPA